MLLIIIVNHQKKAPLPCVRPHGAYTLGADIQQTPRRPPQPLVIQQPCGARESLSLVSERQRTLTAAARSSDRYYAVPLSLRLPRFNRCCSTPPAPWWRRPEQLAMLPRCRACPTERLFQCKNQHAGNKSFSLTESIC